MFLLCACMYMYNFRACVCCIRRLTRDVQPVLLLFFFLVENILLFSSRLQEYYYSCRDVVRLCQKEEIRAIMVEKASFLLVLHVI
jgi:hypothetical protein